MRTYSLPERSAIALEFWLAGHEILWEGRRLILAKTEGSQALAVGALAEVLKFEQGREPRTEDTILELNMSLTRFLLIIGQMPPGDIQRMEQINARDQYGE